MFRRMLKYMLSLLFAALLIGAGVLFHMNAYREFNSHMLAQRQLAVRRGELPANTQEFPQNIAFPPGLSQRISTADMLQQGSVVLIPLVVIASLAAAAAIPE